MSRWRLIDSGPSGAFRNMALDEALALEAERPALRFYGWSAPSVSIGCFQDASELDIEYLSNKGMSLVRRLTGGRGILHGHELTYSFSAPATGAFAGGLRETYLLIGKAFASALKSLGLKPETSLLRGAVGPGRETRSRRSPLCFESASVGEIKLGGRKLIGSAQKRWPGRFMQQGSMPFVIDYPELSRVFNGAPEARHAMSGLLDAAPSLGIEALKAAVVSAFEETFGVEFEVSGPTVEEEALAAELESARYACSNWNLGRQNCKTIENIPGVLLR